MNRSFPRPLRVARYSVMPTCRGWQFPWGQYAHEAPDVPVCLECGRHTDLCECEQGARLEPKTAPLAA